MTTENDAIFQNVRFVTIRQVPANCAATLASWRLCRTSGANAHNAAATATVNAPSPAHTARQPAKPSSHSSGEPTTTPPRPPTAITKPFRSGSLATGKCCASALNAPPRHTETPTPINRRPTIIVPMSCAAPNTHAPAAATSSSAALTRRGP